MGSTCEKEPDWINLQQPSAALPLPCQTDPELSSIGLSPSLKAWRPSYRMRSSNPGRPLSFPSRNDGSVRRHCSRFPCCYRSCGRSGGHTYLRQIGSRQGVRVATNEHSNSALHRCGGPPVAGPSASYPTLHRRVPEGSVWAIGKLSPYTADQLCSPWCPTAAAGHPATFPALAWQ